MPGLDEIERHVPSRPSQVVNPSGGDENLQRPNITADMHSGDKSQEGTRPMPWGAKVSLLLNLLQCPWTYLLIYRLT